MSSKPTHLALVRRPAVRPAPACNPATHVRSSLDLASIGPRTLGASILGRVRTHQIEKELQTRVQIAEKVLSLAGLGLKVAGIAQQTEELLATGQNRLLEIALQAETIVTAHAIEQALVPQQVVLRRAQYEQAIAEQANAITVTRLRGCELQDAAIDQALALTRNAVALAEAETNAAITDLEASRVRAARRADIEDAAFQAEETLRLTAPPSAPIVFTPPAAAPAPPPPTAPVDPEEARRAKEVRELQHQIQLAEMRRQLSPDAVLPATHRTSSTYEMPLEHRAALDAERESILRRDCDRIGLDVATGTIHFDEQNRYHGYAGLVYEREVARRSPEEALQVTIETLYRRRNGQPLVTMREAQNYYDQYQRVLQGEATIEQVGLATDLLHAVGLDVEDRYATPQRP